MIHPELTLRLPNSPGALAGICRLLSDEHVNIVALALETNGRLHLVVDNPVRATGVLASHHHQVVQQDVLVIATGNQPGAVAPGGRARRVRARPHQEVDRCDPDARCPLRSSSPRR